MKKKLIIQLTIILCFNLPFLNGMAKEKLAVPKAIPVVKKNSKDSVEAQKEIPVNLQYSVFSEEEMIKQRKNFEKDKGWRELLKETRERIQR